MISLFLFQCKQTGNTGFGKVEVISPDDNRISPKKVSLGKKLFFDNIFRPERVLLVKLPRVDSAHNSTSIIGTVVIS